MALLAIFNVHDFHPEHWVFTVVFIVGVALNAIANTVEIRYLAETYWHLRYIRRNTIAKIVLVSLGVGMILDIFYKKQYLTLYLVFAIAMAILLGNCDDRTNDGHCDAQNSTAAVFEWSISVIFFGFLITYVVDFRVIEEPPASVRQRQDQQIQMQRQAAADLEQRAGPKPAVADIPAAPQIGSGVA